MSSIDDLFKEKIRDHSMPYSDMLWSKIDAEINPVKEKSRWFPFLLFGLFALLMIGGFFWYNSSNLISRPADDSDLSLENNTFNFQSETAISDEELTEKINHSLQTGKLESLNIETTSSIQKTQLGLSSDIDKNRITHSTEVAKNKETQSSQLSRSSQFSESSNSSRSGLSNTNEPHSIAKGNQISIEKTDNTAQQRSFLGIDEIVNGTKIFASNDMSSTIDNLALKKIEQIDYLGFTPRMLSSQNESSRSLAMPCGEYNNTNCEDLYVLKSGWFGEIYYTNEYAIRKFRARTPEYSDYKNIRDESELELYSFSTGFRAQFLSSKGVSFKTGINYSQINELYRFTDPESGRYKEVIIRDEVTGQIIDSISYYIPGEERVRTYNRYKMLDVPIIFGFESLRTNKLSYSVNAGVYFNLMFRQRGQFMAPNANQDVWFTSNQPGAYKAYKTRIGISYYTSIGGIYHWSDKWDVFADVSMRFYPDSFSLDDYFLIQKYTVVGLNTGLRYKF